MIRAYQQSHRSEVCRVFDCSKPYELASGGVIESFVPLATDEKRMTDFSNSTIFVWDEAGTLRGFIGNSGSFIGWLFVDRSAFRKGIGRALLRYLLASTPGEPWLWAMKNNQAAISLYRSEGFDIVEERSSHNGGLPCKAVKLCYSRKKPNQSPQPTRRTGG